LHCLTVLICVGTLEDATSCRARSLLVCYAVTLLLMPLLQHVSILYGHHQVSFLLRTRAEGSVTFELSPAIRMTGLPSGSHDGARTEPGLRAGRPSNLERKYYLQRLNRHWDPLSLLFSGKWELVGPEYEAGRPHSSSSEVRCCVSTPPYFFMSWCLIKHRIVLLYSVLFYLHAPNFTLSGWHSRFLLERYRVGDLVLRQAIIRSFIVFL
jgi:hypothetical protein